jgi:hypothetical protein
MQIFLACLASLPPFGKSVESEAIASREFRTQRRPLEPSRWTSTGVSHNSVMSLPQKNPPEAGRPVVSAKARLFAHGFIDCVFGIAFGLLHVALGFLRSAFSLQPVAAGRITNCLLRLAGELVGFPRNFISGRTRFSISS